MHIPHPSNITGLSRLTGATLGALAMAACAQEAPVAEAPASSNGAAKTTASVEQPVMGPERRILAFGDSLFAGYGLEEGESYPARLEAALRARGVNARIVNAGVSGDTTAAGRQRLAFTLDSQPEPPELFILELGGNDLLRGLPTAQTRENIAAMLEELRQRDIPVLLMGMRAPPNLGRFQAQFDALYPELAEEYGAQLYPFFLEDIYREPTLFQSDRVHPTAKGIERLVAATVEQVDSALPEPVGS